MKNKTKILFLLFFIGIINTINAQDILWEKSFGGKQAEYLMDAQATADYGFILVGSSLSKKSGNKADAGIGDLDYWVWKMKEDGNLDWQKSFGGTGADFLQSIGLTTDGGYVLGGTSNSEKGFDKLENGRGNDDLWIIKLDAKGNAEWQKTIGGSGQEKLQSIRQTLDGGYIIGASSSSSKSGEKTMDGFGNMDYWVIKLDNKGAIKWQKNFGGKYNDELRSIEQTKDGGYLVGGYSNSPSSGNKTDDNKGIGDFWVLKLDTNGVVQWQKTIGGDKDDQLYVVHQSYDGNYLVAGNSNSPLTPEGGTGSKTIEGTDFWVLKLDEKGEILWQETYNIGKVDILTSLVENEDHTLLLGGFAQGEFSSPIAKKGIMQKATKAVKAPQAKKGTDDYVVIKVDEQGQELWRRTVGSNGEDLLKKAIETRDGSYLLAGTSNAASSGDKKSAIGSNDFWVVKLKDKAKPEKVKLKIEAYPNPAQTFTTIIIGYDFEYGTATVADLAGHALQSFDISSKTVPIDLSGLPEGIYIVNIKTNVQSDGVKVIKTNNKN